MKKLLKKIINKLVHAEQSPYRLARSICLGIYIAFSPFLGIQTILVFLLSWLTRLNATVAFIILYTVNNPWTMLPIVMLDYSVGYLLIQKLMGFDLSAYNPAWIMWISSQLAKYTPIANICLWCYLIGGNIIALSISLLLYPAMVPLCKKLLKYKLES